jgi:hypothetical protein
LKEELTLTGQLNNAGVKLKEKLDGLQNFEEGIKNDNQSSKLSKQIEMYKEIYEFAKLAGESSVETEYLNKSVAAMVEKMILLKKVGSDVGEENFFRLAAYEELKSYSDMLAKFLKDTGTYEQFDWGRIFDIEKWKGIDQVKKGLEKLVANFGETVNKMSLKDKASLIEKLLESEDKLKYEKLLSKLFGSFKTSVEEEFDRLLQAFTDGGDIEKISLMPALFELEQMLKDMDLKEALLYLEISVKQGSRGISTALSGMKTALAQQFTDDTWKEKFLTFGEMLSEGITTVLNEVGKNVEVPVEELFKLLETSGEKGIVEAIATILGIAVAQEAPISDTIKEIFNKIGIASNTNVQKFLSSLLDTLKNKANEFSNGTALVAKDIFDKISESIEMEADSQSQRIAKMNIYGKLLESVTNPTVREAIISKMQNNAKEFSAKLVDSIVSETALKSLLEELQSDNLTEADFQTVLNNIKLILEERGLLNQETKLVFSAFGDATKFNLEESTEQLRSVVQNALTELANSNATMTALEESIKREAEFAKNLKAVQLQNTLNEQEQLAELFSNSTFAADEYLDALESVVSTLAELILLSAQGVEIAGIDEMISKLASLKQQIEETKIASERAKFTEDMRTAADEANRLSDYYANVVNDADKLGSHVSSIASKFEQMAEEAYLKYGLDSAEYQEAIGLAEKWTQEVKNREEAEKSAKKELEKQKKLMENQAKLLNGIMGSIAGELSKLGPLGELIGSVLSQLQFTVETLEDGSSRIVSPFEDIETLTTNIGLAIAQWAIKEIGNQLGQILKAFEKIDELMSKSKFDLGMAGFAQTLKDYNEFEKNQAALAAKQGERIWAGVLDFFSFGLFGFGKKVDKEIDDIEQKLKATADAVASAFGFGTSEIMSSIESAFEAASYEEFISNFSESLEKMTKRALLRALLANEIVQAASNQLSQAVVNAIEDGLITPEELANINNAGENLKEKLKAIWDMMQQLGLTAQGFGEELSGGNAVTHSITEQTGNRIAALLSTINLHVSSIDLNVSSIRQMFIEGITVNMDKIGGVEAREYLYGLGIQPA